MVIPEAGVDAAQQVAHRNRERVAEEEEVPPFTVSVGMAVYPPNGEMIESLLAAAVRALYEMKRPETAKP